MSHGWAGHKGHTWQKHQDFSSQKGIANHAFAVHNEVLTHLSEDMTKNGMVILVS